MSRAVDLLEWAETHGGGCPGALDRLACKADSGELACDARSRSPGVWQGPLSRLESAAVALEAVGVGDRVVRREFRAAYRERVERDRVMQDHWVPDVAA